MIMKVISFIAHKFYMGDVDDPDLYASEPLLAWEKSEAGQYVMANAVETPVWNVGFDNDGYGYHYTITAKLSSEKYVYYQLKYL